MTNEHDTIVEAPPLKLESVFRSAWRFTTYYFAAWLIAAALTYICYYPGAYLALRIDAVGIDGAADFEKVPWEQIALLALSRTEQVVSTWGFSMFAAVWGLGSVLCRRSV
jgi:hypothetical protein